MPSSHATRLCTRTESSHQKTLFIQSHTVNLNGNLHLCRSMWQKSKAEIHKMLNTTRIMICIRTAQSVICLCNQLHKEQRQSKLQQSVASIRVVQIAMQNYAKSRVGAEENNSNHSTYLIPTSELLFPLNINRVYGILAAWFVLFALFAVEGLPLSRYFLPALIIFAQNCAFSHRNALSRCFPPSTYMSSCLI